MIGSVKAAGIIVARYGAGFSIKGIAKDLSITPAYAYYCVEQHKPGALAAIRAERRARFAAIVKEHLAAGGNGKSAAITFGVTTETIRHLVGSSPRAETDWTADLIRRLIEAWGQGLSTRLIGVRLGVSRNAVIGKAHRIGLPKRQSPIKRKEPAMEQAA